MGGLGVFLLSPKGRDPLTPRERPGEGGVVATRLRLLLAQAAAGRTSVGKHFRPVVSDHLRRACEAEDIFCKCLLREARIFVLDMHIFLTVYKNCKQILITGTTVHWPGNWNKRRKAIFSYFDMKKVNLGFHVITPYNYKFYQSMIDFL
jgi:hypothetical protein